MADDSVAPGMEAAIANIRVKCAEARSSERREVRMAGEAVEATIIPFVEWMTARAQQASRDGIPAGDFCTDLLLATQSVVANVIANTAGCLAPTLGAKYSQAAAYVIYACSQHAQQQVGLFDEAFIARSSFVGGVEKTFDFRDLIKKET